MSNKKKYYTQKDIEDNAITSGLRVYYDTYKQLRVGLNTVDVQLTFRQIEDLDLYKCKFEPFIVEVLKVGEGLGRIQTALDMLNIFIDSIKEKVE